MPAPTQPDAPRLRIALLTYRGNPRSGGQGVYARYLTRELVELGHSVTVFSGPPFPVLDDPARLVEVPSLDLYRSDEPFRRPALHEFRSRADVAEYAIMCTAGFPEPYAFSLRARRLLATRRLDFDLVHDNQCLGRGLVTMTRRDDWPLLATLHHPITVDREVEIAHAATLRRRLSLRRWYGFLGMQRAVASQLPRILTSSEASRRDIVDHMGVNPDRVHVVPVGVDTATFDRRRGAARVPGRIMTTASADVAMKGLVPLVEAVAKARTENDAVHLVVVGRLRDDSNIPDLVERLGLEDKVRFVSDVSTERLVDLYAETELACVPSLYEGFSLPAVEAMACGVPVVATTGGALPEVVGRDGDAGLLVPPGDPSALAAAFVRLLGDAGLRERLGAAGRARAATRFTWRSTAERTVDHYRALLTDRLERPRREHTC